MQLRIKRTRGPDKR